MKKVMKKVTILLSTGVKYLERGGVKGPLICKKVP
jgi:hypothetical protein